jgi:hypothetical protein
MCPIVSEEKQTVIPTVIPNEILGLRKSWAGNKQKSQLSTYTTIYIPIFIF